MTSKTFRPWRVDETWLLPPSVEEFVPAGHPAHLIRDMVREELELGAILSAHTEARGFPPDNPGMMVALLLDAYSRGRRARRGPARRRDAGLDGRQAAPPFAHPRRPRGTRGQGGGQGGGRAGPRHHGGRHAGQAARPQAPLRCPSIGFAAGTFGNSVQPPGTPEPTPQRNVTDPDSRIMLGRDGFVQADNGQAAVDADNQVIVAHRLTANASDQDGLPPLVDAPAANTGGLPDEVSADNGFCSEANLAGLVERKLRGDVATGRAKHPANGTGRGSGPLIAAMRRRIRQGGHRSRDRLRKHVVEPVFGQIKTARGFRQFLFRGIERVRHEWALLCTVHTLVKLTS